MRDSEAANVMRVLGRRWSAILIVCAVGFAGLWLAGRSMASYKASTDLLIVSEALKDTTVSDPDLPAILGSNQVLARVIRRLNLQTDPTALAKKIKIKLPVKSSVIELTYEDRSGARAAAVANAIADEATTYFHEIATRGYTDVIDALSGRIADTQAKMALADRQLQNASSANHFASSERAIDDSIAQIDQLKVQGGQLNAALAADRATAGNLDSQLTTIAPIVHGEILQKDIVYQMLQTQLAKDVADLISERASFHDSFPGVSTLARRVERERQQIQSLVAAAIHSGAGSSASYTQTVLDKQRAAGTVDADRERLRTTDAEVVAEQERLAKVAGAGAAINTLRAKRDAAVQQYIGLAQRLSAAQADAAQGASLGRLVVVSRAIPGPPMLPVTTLLGIAVLVIVLAIGSAYAWDSVDRHLWGAREIERLYGRPVVIEVGRPA